MRRWARCASRSAAAPPPRRDRPGGGHRGRRGRAAAAGATDVPAAATAEVGRGQADPLHPRPGLRVQAAAPGSGAGAAPLPPHRRPARCWSAPTPPTTPPSTASATTWPSCRPSTSSRRSCDDPYDFGAIAAANSLSDIYAMGAEPLFALNIVGFPTQAPAARGARADPARGASRSPPRPGSRSSAATRSTTPSPSSGWPSRASCTPTEVLTNAAARPGDALVLTKPIGTGILATAVKRGLRRAEHVARRDRRTMAALNRAAAEAMGRSRRPRLHRRDRLRAARPSPRDGARPSGVDAELWSRDGPGARRGTRPGRGRRRARRDARQPRPRLAPRDVAARTRAAPTVILADAQTSGGLLVAVAAAHAEALATRFAERDVKAARVGEVTDRGTGRILCRRA